MLSIMTHIITQFENCFLLAAPHLKDRYFRRTVIYVAEHDEKEGACGFIINKPMNIGLKRLMKHLGFSYRSRTVMDVDPPVMRGGPVANERGFILTRTSETQVKLSSDKEELEKLSVPAQQDSIVFLGYAGWPVKKLEAEIKRNDWLVCPADLALLFETPVEDRWKQGLKQLTNSTKYLHPLTGIA